MLKLNNKGFAISTLLYGLLVLIVIIIYLTYHIINTNNANTKTMSDDINEELSACRNERVKYNVCFNEGDCNLKYEEYKQCYCTKIYKDNQTCNERLFD